VFDVAVRGAPVKEIAAELHVTEATVASHLSRIYAKLGVRGRAELIARASRSARHASPGATEQGSPPRRTVAALWAGTAMATLGLAAGIVMPLPGVLLGPLLLVAAWRGASDLGWARWLVAAVGALLVAEGVLLLIVAQVG
jgi:hypothetical protein